MVPLEPFKNKVFKLRRQGPGKRSLPGRPTKASQGTFRDAPHVPARQQGPGKRSLPGRPTQALRRTCRDAPRVPARQQGPGKRSLPGGPTKASRGPVSGKLPDPTRQRPRQGACRGRRPLCTHAPAHPPACRHEASSGARGGRLDSQGGTVVSGADKKAVLANSSAPNGHFWALFRRLRHAFNAFVPWRQG